MQPSPRIVTIRSRSLVATLVCLCLAPAAPAAEPAGRRISVEPAAVTADASVRYDYELIYVRAPRRSDGKEILWADFAKPTEMELGADLVLLRPDGSEEVLVEGDDGSVMDPYVSFDGQTVFYAKFIDKEHSGSDVYKIHVPSRRVTKLTDQTFTPNTGAADWSKLKLSYGVYNLGPCPVPSGRVAFTSNRNAHVPPRGYPRVALQLFTMDEADGANVEQVGYLNIACALHPVILKDGRLLFSSLESHALHQGIHWGIWSIHPDGTNWNPVVSALLKGGTSESGFHFQTQLSDETIVVQRYYNQNQRSFGTLYTLPPRVPAGATAFGPGYLEDPRNRVEFVDVTNGQMTYDTMPFTPYGFKRITPWVFFQDSPAYPSVLDDQKSPRVGKVTHPCGAPDNHLLVAWSMGPIGGNGVHDFMGPTPIDAGIYLIKGGQTTSAPGEMLRVKNDPKFNEIWPRPLVPYARVYGVDEPARLEHANDGRRSPHLPEGTPFGLVGASSLYKRESAPQGRVPEGSVTAEVPVQPGDTIESIARFRSVFSFGGSNWAGQGADAGVYANGDIHAIRILIQEPLTDVQGHRQHLFGSHANERLRILGEIPVRKFGKDGKQPTDPDNNPDTSFLFKLPADQSYTFQTIDKDGMVLNMAQTWHQVRPGEVRNDCGGCHAHSQRPTDFNLTAAAKPDYEVFDLTQRTPVLTAKATDQSGRKWDKDDQTGLRYLDRVLDVEYWRDVRPILNRSCVACHTQKWDKPAGGLVLDDDKTAPVESVKLTEGDDGPSVPLPATYRRIVSRRGNESFYMQRFQSRRSYLIWKVYGRRLDGWTNDTFPSTVDPKNPASGMRWRGAPVPEYEKLVAEVREGKTDDDWLPIFARNHGDTDFAGSPMPPPEAVEGTFKGQGGQTIKVPPLSDEDRRTLVRWIDVGCPIDLDPQYDPAAPSPRSFGWTGDDQRPTVALTHPHRGESDAPLTRVLVGLADAYSGLDLKTFSVTADFEIDGAKAGEELAGRFESLPGGRLQLVLRQPIHELPKGKLTVSVKDRQGNIGRVERAFSIGAGKAKTVAGR